MDAGGMRHALVVVEMVGERDAGVQSIIRYTYVKLEMLVAFF